MDLTDYIDSFVEENYGEVSISDTAYHFFNLGKKHVEEQLMAKAFDFTIEHNIACVLASVCLRFHGWFNRERDFNDLLRHLSCVDELFEGKFSGKTKVVVIKGVDDGTF